jgi:hypothetical protein
MERPSCDSATPYRSYQHPRDSSQERRKLARGPRHGQSKTDVGEAHMHSIPFNPVTQQDTRRLAYLPREIIAS